MYTRTKLPQSCLTLCDPMDYSPPGSSVHGILQSRILEWVANPPPGIEPDPRIEPVSPALVGGFFLFFFGRWVLMPTREALI